jgi:hypothetical protein
MRRTAELDAIAGASALFYVSNPVPRLDFARAIREVASVLLLD